MKPKEKAINLIQSFIDVGFLPAAARIGALVAVDEIILANPLKFDEDDNPMMTDWWKEVKKEIEEL